MVAHVQLKMTQLPFADCKVQDPPTLSLFEWVGQYDSSTFKITLLQSWNIYGIDNRNTTCRLSNTDEIFQYLKGYVSVIKVYYINIPNTRGVPYG